MKKLFFLVAFMGTIPCMVKSAVTDGTFWYELYNNGTATLTYNEDPRSTGYSNVGPELIIPSYVCYEDSYYEVTKIGPWVFTSAESVTSLVIPETIQYIGLDAFSGCKGITSVVWNARNCSLAGNLFYSGNYSFGKNITDFTFGDNVRRIPNKVCYKLLNLKSISLPQGVTSIGEEAFLGCSGLTSITIPSHVTSIGDGAFAGCSSLKSYTFATDDIALANEKDTVFFLNTNGWDEVYAYAWSNNGSNAEWPGIPAQKLQYTYLGYEVYYFVADKGEFDNCIFNNTGYGAGNQTDDLVWISGMCYNNNTWISIEKNDLEGGVEIGAEAFEDCVGLTAISFPDCVKSIGERAFGGCSNIETITIGSNVKDIGEYAFSGCQSVYEITCKATKAPNVYESTFDAVSTLATLYVPAESIQKYKIHAVWSRFFNIEPIKETSEAVDNTNQDGVSFNQKIIRNGQVLIVRDGEIYSILGEKIE